MTKNPDDTNQNRDGAGFKRAYFLREKNVDKTGMTQFTIQNRDSTNVIEIPVAQHIVLTLWKLCFLALYAASAFLVPSSYNQTWHISKCFGFYIFLPNVINGKFSHFFHLFFAEICWFLL